MTPAPKHQLIISGPTRTLTGATRQEFRGQCLCGWVEKAEMVWTLQSRYQAHVIKRQKEAS
jgi:hypothetical protein